MSNPVLLPGSARVAAGVLAGALSVVLGACSGGGRTDITPAQVPPFTVTEGSEVPPVGVTEPPSTPAPTTSTSTMAPTTTAAPLIDASSWFGTDSATLTGAARADLAAWVDAYRSALEAASTVLVEGWADDRGSNQVQLSSDRAATVASYLATSVPMLAGRITAVGHGTDGAPFPGCHGDCPGNRAVRITVDG